MPFTARGGFTDPTCPTSGCALDDGHDGDCLWAHLSIPQPGTVRAVAHWRRSPDGAVAVTVTRYDRKAGEWATARQVSATAAAKLTLSCHPPAPFAVAFGVAPVGLLVSA